jgi:hypothetical protein
MSFLKRLFGGGGSAATPQGTVNVYVKVRRTGEVVPLRLRRGYDISEGDDGRLFARKTVMGKRSFERVEATIYFDKNNRVTEAELPGGELSDEGAYLEQQENAQN